MEKVNVKEIVKDTIAKFEYAACGVLYYKIVGNEITCIIPVDMNDREDVGTTKFESEYKSITLLRYINKSIKNDSIVIYPTKITSV